MMKKRADETAHTKETRKMMTPVPSLQEYQAMTEADRDALHADASFADDAARRVWANASYLMSLHPTPDSIAANGAAEDARIATAKRCNDLATLYYTATGVLA